MTNTTTTNYGRALVAGVVVALGVVAAAGCSQGNHPVAGESFRPEGEVRSVHQFADAQAAAGARADATLRAVHFDRGDLNSLGQEKLDLMLGDDDACTPLVVRIDVADDAMADARRDAVRVYLKDRGVSDDQVKLETGPNTKYTFGAKGSLAGKQQLDGGTAAPAGPAK